jgi:hypothetical protein
MVAVGGSLWVAAETKVGPSIRLSYRHGVHVGDISAVLVGALAASAVTWRVLRSTYQVARPD